MRISIPVLAALCAVTCATPVPVDVDARARELAHSALIVDGHVDVPYRLWEQKTKGPMDDIAGP